ncbi:DUF397 domain-containing protein [Amycolatopsis sp. NPDC059021]|uniref:DUF397 domain-containing protein n=1 Tax=Amycolatopsis sp. NPDC059021 TaxID=3346704 RepID=UPI00366CF0C5
MTDLPVPNWRKSSYSSGNNGACVEVATPPTAAITSRDTKARATTLPRLDKPSFKNPKQPSSADRGRSDGTTPRRRDRMEILASGLHERRQALITVAVAGHSDVTTARGVEV